MSAESIFFAILFLLVVATPFSIIQIHKNRIKTLLESRGATKITIAFLLLRSNRINYAYEVQFFERNGRFRRTKCKISLIDRNIYWMDEDSS